MIKPWLLKHEMHMTGSETVAFQSLQKLPYRSIMWDRIRHRDDGFEPKDPLFITVHHCPLVRTFAARILDIVISLAISFPDIDLDFLNWLATGIFDCAQNETWLAVRIMGDLGAICLYLSFMGVEWSENRTLCTCWRLWMIDAIYQQ
jgi:hypothetical protein